MIVYQVFVNEGSILVQHPVEDPYEYAELRYLGDESLVSEVRAWLDYAEGPFGNMIGTCTTGTDLVGVMEQKPPFDVKCKEGAELVTEYPLVAVG